MRARARARAGRVRDRAYPFLTPLPATPATTTPAPRRPHHPLPRRLPGPGRPPLPGLLPVQRAVVHGGGDDDGDGLPRWESAHQRGRAGCAVAVVDGFHPAR